MSMFFMMLKEQQVQRLIADSSRYINTLDARVIRNLDIYKFALQTWLLSLVHNSKIGFLGTK